MPPSATQAKTSAARPRRPVRQVDIARAAGVSAGAVSAVLSAKEGSIKNRIHPDTAERIRQVAREMGYRTDVLAHALRGGKSRSIAALWADFDGDVINRLMREVQQQGYGVYYAYHLQTQAYLLQTLEDLLHRRVDLLLIQVQHADLADPQIQACLAAFPVVIGVVLDETLAERFPGDVIVHDHRPAIEAAIDHFKLAGRSRLALVHTRSANNIYKEQAFLSHCQAMGLPRPKLFDAPHRWEVQKRSNYVQAMREAFEIQFFPVDRSIDVDALLTASDEAAMIACRVFESRGLRIPEDIAVVGMNDTDAAALWQPPLATISRQSSRLEEVLTRRVLARLSEVSEAQQIDRVPMTFLPRLSAGTAPAAVD